MPHNSPSRPRPCGTSRRGHTTGMGSNRPGDLTTKRGRPPGQKKGVDGIERDRRMMSHLPGWREMAIIPTITIAMLAMKHTSAVETCAMRGVMTASLAMRVVLLTWHLEKTPVGTIDFDRHPPFPTSTCMQHMLKCTHSFSRVSPNTPVCTLTECYQEDHVVRFVKEEYILSGTSMS